MVESDPATLAVLPVALALAAVHVLAGRLRLQSVPRSLWLSGAGGVSVAYVFVHVLPELGERQPAFAGSEAPLASAERHVYVLALAGFVVFYALERLARRSAERQAVDGTSRPGDESGDEVGGARTGTSAGVFWIHVGSFGAYNALVGYLLVHREEGGPTSLAFFAFAIALHFVVNDHGLREHHGEAYDHWGRWLLAGGVLAGTALGWATAVEELLVSALFAFLAGGIVLNVVKEELPEERASDVRAFGGGAAAYAVILLFL